MKYILCLLGFCTYLSAAVPTIPAWSSGTLNNQVINGQTRYWVEATFNGQRFVFWYIDTADARTNGQVDLGTRVQFSTRRQMPRLGAEPRPTAGQKNGGWDGDYAYEYHPEGQNIWRSDYGRFVHELFYRHERPLYMLTDGVEAMIAGVRPHEFHIDALEYFMGENPRGELQADDPNYISNGSSVSGACLRPLTVTLTTGYWILERELSQVQWMALMGAKPQHWPAGDPSTLGYAAYPWDETSSNPVAFITTKDAADCIAALNAMPGVLGQAQLPSEAEWEYACRIPNRVIANSSGEAQQRAWSDQDMPFAYGMHLYDPMMFYFSRPAASPFTKDAQANTFHAIFDFRYTFSYNLPSFRPSTPADNDDVDNTAHYTRGYANNERGSPVMPGDNGWGKINVNKQNDWGLVHIHGNVAELVRDVWDGVSPHNVALSASGTTDYRIDMSSGPAWRMQFQPTKGGSWMSGGSQCRASARGRLLRYDLNKYPFINADGSIDATKADPRCYADTVGFRPIIYVTP